MSKWSRLRAIALAVILSSLPVLSFAKGYRSVVVSMTDGTTTTVALEAEMTMRLTDTSVEFVSTDNTTVTLEKQTVASMSFSELSGIADVANNAGKFSFSGNVISIAGLAKGSVVTVHDVAGRCVNREATDGGNYELRLGSFSAGVYIVSVNGVSYKIEVK